MKNIFIIGSKGIPAKYGGFETFVDKLTGNKQNENIKYHVSCLADNEEEYVFNNARCFNVKVSDIGSAKAITYDIKSLLKAVKYIKDNKINEVIIYILACRIGPFLSFYKKNLERLGIKVYINPDGHEWKRSKWNKYVKAYWKISEKLMIKNADLVICDSIGIEEYIKTEYKEYKPNTIFIPYGANVISLDKDTDKLSEWYKKFNIQENNYYLVVGRFVPENNYEVMIKEFMKSKTEKDLVIITNVEKNNFYEGLLEKTRFTEDKRIKFVGTVYDADLLDLIRKKAYAYMHGHEVGGTNPSLLEALATTNINILLDVIFNKEVGGNAAFYFNKQEGNLSNKIDEIDKLSSSEITDMGSKAKATIKQRYSWEKVIDDYEKTFMLK